jgi:hypothetical protein
MNARIALAAIGMTAVAVVSFADPATSNLFPPCLWRTATGWLCPGCGSARALHALVHGRFADAVAFNPLTVAALPLIGLYLLDSAGSASHAMTYRVRPSHLHWLAGGVLVFGILRNV